MVTADPAARSLVQQRHVPQGRVAASRRPRVSDRPQRDRVAVVCERVVADERRGRAEVVERAVLAGDGQVEQEQARFVTLPRATARATVRTLRMQGERRRSTASLSTGKGWKKR